MIYEITMYGYGNLGVSDVRWYIKKMGTDTNCGGLSNWDPEIWTHVDTKTIETHIVSQKKV